MQLIQETYEDVLVQGIELTRATLKEAGEIKNTLHQSIEQGYRKIVVDLSLCEFIDSSFLGALVVSLKKVTALGGNLKLVGFQPAVRLMLERTKMNKVFESFPTKEAAIRSFDE